MTRIVVGGLGLFACVWAYAVLPSVRSDLAIDSVGRSIIAGESYKDAKLSVYEPVLSGIALDGGSRPNATRNMMVIQLRRLEDAVSEGQRSELDSRARDLRLSIERQLSVTPTDSFAWLALFWLSNFQDGYSPTHLSYLKMSYVLGPNEGWIALRRNPIALAVFDDLPADLAELAIGEFVRLVDSGFYKDAARILISQGWPRRDKLLPKLMSASISNRTLFARYLYGLGYVVDVPGVTKAKMRPWQ